MTLTTLSPIATSPPLPIPWQSCALLPFSLPFLFPQNTCLLLKYHLINLFIYYLFIDY